MEDASVPRRRHRTRFRLQAQILVALLVGVATGVVVAALHVAILAIWNRFAERDTPWVVLLPVAGLLLASVALAFTRSRSGATTEEYIRVFHDPDGHVDLQAVPARLLAAVSTIGLGGSMGLEGPSIYAGSAIGDWAERRFSAFMDEPATGKVILIAGAAAGIAAIFKAPVTGIVFALEVPYIEDLARRALIPAIFASAASYLIFVALTDTTPLFPISGVALSVHDLVACLLVGVGGGLAARLFVAAYRASEALRERIPFWIRPFVGGACLAVIGLICLHAFHRPLALGPGYVGIRLIASGALGARLLVLLFVLKLLATCATGEGNGVGGLFFPSVMMGAATGAALGEVVPGPSSLFAVVGMAAFLSGAYNVPLAGVTFVAETTGAPGYIIPGLLAAAIAYLVSGRRSLSSHQTHRA